MSAIFDKMFMKEITFSLLQRFKLVGLTLFSLEIEFCCEKNAALSDFTYFRHKKPLEKGENSKSFVYNPRWGYTKDLFALAAILGGYIHQGGYTPGGYTPYFTVPNMVKFWQKFWQ